MRVGQHATLRDPYGLYTHPTSDAPNVAVARRTGSADDITALAPGVAVISVMTGCHGRNPTRVCPIVRIVVKAK